MCQETRACSKCGRVLPLTEEYFSKNQSTNTGGDKYFRPDCKECYNKMVNGRKIAYEKAGKPERPLEGYNPKTKRTENGHPCALCKRTTYPKKIVFDHCHDTLEFRGWLCDSCNRSLGILGDTVEGLSNSLAYIAEVEEYKDEIVQFVKQLQKRKKGEPPKIIKDVVY